ncbi:hypothetical protein GCM10017783_25490 [Deinococcus piscis]|uniref:Uncharacterized protein n=1 Tax=Deinococcus piscis TaxID=394230 RepID=A0ABQ3KBY1_9DEIO|nr:hypothetical protein [Deinococcus piscis]GHG12226.1 hypothetical protein GCM10017783_25490 [Deinococcus piscis]
MLRPTPSPTWRDCPRCRYPMTRWSELAGETEPLWVAWNPTDSWLPLHILILGGLMLLALASPTVGTFIFGPHQRGWAWGLAEAIGLALATLAGAVTLWMRRSRRARLTHTLQPHDLVCARCLHAEPVS